jgi:hypothetical protein
VPEPYPAEFAPTSADRIARNDAIFREANEDIAAVAEEEDVEGRVPFICECAEPSCREIVRLTLDEYREIRSDPRAFVNAVGHQQVAKGWVEVLAERDGHVVVRKVGRAGDVAAELADEHDDR